MILDFHNYTNISYVGDMHGYIKEFVDNISSVQNTLFICTGDVCLGTNPYEIDMEMIERIDYKLSKNNNRLLIIRGNCDNPKYFKEKSSFRAELTDNDACVILVPDYSIIKTTNHNILCIGGARSIDRQQKIKGYNWWQNENIQAMPDDLCEYCGSMVDVIVSHSAPLFAYPIEFSNEDKQYCAYLLNAWTLFDKTVKNDIYKDRLLLQNVYEKLNSQNHIKYWIYGHYHKSIDVTYNDTVCISLDIKEIKNLQ